MWVLRALASAGLALLFVAGGSAGPLAAQQSEEHCDDSYPRFTRFVIQDGGADGAGNVVRFCSEFLRLGGERTLGLPISRPFRVGS
jgi:hypothetical protein